jgi:hypothetical protein
MFGLVSRTKKIENYGSRIEEQMKLLGEEKPRRR